MHQTKNTQKILVWVALAVMVISAFISGFTLWYLTVNRDSIATQLERSLKEELAKYNLDIKEPITIDDAKIVLAVAKYCESNNNCQGKQGFTGPMGQQGVQGIQGLMGINGLNGRDGTKGEKGDTGEQGPIGPQGPEGQQGVPGSTYEYRCKVVNETKRRIEVKYTDVETWEVLYYLAPGQLCEGEIQG